MIGNIGLVFLGSMAVRGGVGGQTKQGCSDNDARDTRAKKERCNSQLELLLRAET